MGESGASLPSPHYLTAGGQETQVGVGRGLVQVQRYDLLTLTWVVLFLRCSDAWGGLMPAWIALSLLAQRGLERLQDSVVETDEADELHIGWGRAHHVCGDSCGFLERVAVGADG